MKDDEELINEFKNGSIEAFVTITRKYQNAVMGLAYRFIGDYDEAAEIAQETFVRFYGRADSILPSARLLNYLFTIAANLARTELRRHRRLEPLPEYDNESDDELYSMETASIEYMPDARVDRTELSQQIQIALMKLPPVLREAVILRDIKEYSYEDIADITETELGTVRSRINRARKLLKKLLADIYTEFLL
ncbi:sigma-70 family RNA polymerase sigma factor [Ignavibacteria bacterium]|nr:sigma-70 family RNA polymerase sigma factor [Bacteroidota bacterium]MCZ2132007.1 sigma-70 family RNA polymerase sigma factor [Bacteroidota bacterium]